jgi:hypothetical protein
VPLKEIDRKVGFRDGLTNDEMKREGWHLGLTIFFIFLPLNQRARRDFIFLPLNRSITKD